MIFGISISILSSSSAGSSTPVVHLKCEEMTNFCETYTTNCEDI